MCVDYLRTNSGESAHTGCLRGGDPGVREVKEIGAFTSSGLIFAVYTSAWLELIRQISLLLKRAGHKDSVGKWPGPRSGGEESPLKAEGVSSESIWLLPTNPTCPGDPPTSQREAEPLTSHQVPEMCTGKNLPFAPCIPST